MLLPDGTRAGQITKATLFPFTLSGQRLGVRMCLRLPRRHTNELLVGTGCSLQVCVGVNLRHKSKKATPKKRCGLSETHFAERSQLTGYSSATFMAPAAQEAE